MTYDGTVTIADPALAWQIDADRMPDGYNGYVVYDQDCGNDSPRSWAPNGATLIQESNRCIDIDEDTAGLDEARQRFYKRPDLMERYLAQWRPDILYYRDYLTIGSDGYGWGYVTRDAMAEIGYSGEPSGTLRMRAGTVFDAELETYRQWAAGEVYGVIVTRESDGATASLWGCYDDYPYDSLNGDVVTQLVDEIGDPE